VRGEIRFDSVRKVFRWRRSRARHDSVKGAFFHRRLARRRPEAEEFVALDDISLAVPQGEALAVIGANGSGKSTLLKLASGILRPTGGEVTVDGRVTALIELGAGFHPEITGRENVVINGMLLGLSRQEIEDRMADIIGFADIGPFIDQPVKTYSSGMYVRLGFSVAVAVEPDILLIDEVLAVGDEAFTRRSLDRLARMRQQGVTMVLVSHDLDLVRDFADRALYLDAGRAAAVGPPDTVIARYRSDVAGDQRDTPGEIHRVRVVEEGRRWGTGDVEIVSATVSSQGRELRAIPHGEPCTVHIRYRVLRPVDDAVFGIAWRKPDGTHLGGHNTEIDGLEPRGLQQDGEIRCRYDVLDLAPGSYQLDVAVHKSDGLAFDYWCDAARIRVTSAVEWPGVWAPPHRWDGEGTEWE
jgi:ABC-type polysaccharide/polyol phosphate transport system ATPase subunit